MKLEINKPDSLGALSSTLCLIHCVATPFIFIVQSCTVTCCESTPLWWRFIDYFFLVISFFAIYKTSQASSNNLIKKALWLSWGVLAFVIFNESIQLFPLPEYMIYIPALFLIGLHFYNLKYCQCKTNNCCINHE
ncbi:MerC domain-containing protein [Pseudotamlana agarivorans]|uniref:MerC domain-containing protein n=1 Tax=Pseudotamlana agarivorans TaxID=481183 RepID=UPI00082F895E|nr:MerC domain-containing protein [Tamlana agarivorans]